ncbi:MAG: DUF3325 domain-containing protein [Gammaproteobacteria bacterium]
MNETLWLIAAASLMLLGMGWLALAMETHWKQVYDIKNVKPKQTLLRSIGWLAILASAICCLQADHASMAVLVWIMLLACSAVMVALTLSRIPMLLRHICPRFLNKVEIID